MQNRRDFISDGLAMASLAIAGTAVGETAASPAFFRSALLHLGMNMWGEYAFPGETRYPGYKYIHDHVLTEDAVWNAMIDRMVARHYNLAVIDVGDAVVFPSHPELAIKGSWSADRLRNEVKRLKGLGIEAVPKLNFASGHDGWLKQYGRMVSTRKYYQVVKDLIADAVEIFGKPRFIHIGMDDEDATSQKKSPMVVVRHGDLWWHDVLFCQQCAERYNARTIMFCSSMIDYDAGTIARRLPKSTVLNMALYGHDCTLEWAKAGLKKYGGHWWRNQVWLLDGMPRQLSERGFDILSCSSNWVDVSDKNKYPVVKFGKDYPQDRESIRWFHDFLAKEVLPERLIGGMIASWTAMEKKFLPYLLDGIDQLADALDARGLQK